MMGNTSAKENQLLQIEALASKAEDEVVSVEAFSSFEELPLTQQQWDDFVESVGGEVFLTYDWCRVWWKYYGKNRDLRVFIFRSDNELAGIIPLFFERIWLGPVTVRAVKIVGSDFTLAQFSVPIKHAYMKEVIVGFSESISKLDWDIIHIGPIAGLYKHYDELMNACQKAFSRSCSVTAEDKGVQTYYELADSWDEQIAKLRKGERNKFRRAYKTISSKDSKLVTRYASADTVKEMFDNFVQMHQSQWRKTGQRGHFGDWPRSLSFHLEMAKAQLKLNRLRLLEIVMDDHCLGYEYDYRFGDTRLELLGGRSEQGALTKIGKINFGEKIKRAIEEKVRVVDSMRGRYEYKLRLGGKLFPIRSLYIFRKKPFVLIRVLVFRALSRFLDICYYKIWYCRIAPKLPIRRKGLWRIWIRTHDLLSLN